MFQASCGQPTGEDDANIASCGMFGGQADPSVDLSSVSIGDFLTKLDLAEYKDQFKKKGINNVADLSRMSESEFDMFGFRKLEKRKLIHHVNKARGLAETDSSMLCGAT